MDCPRCESSITRVIKSKHNTFESIRRRRECIVCGLRMTTIEHFEDAGKKESENAKKLYR